MSIELSFEQYSRFLDRHNIDTDGLSPDQILDLSLQLYSEELCRYRELFNNNGGEIRSENSSPTPILDAYRAKIEEVLTLIIKLSHE